MSYLFLGIAAAVLAAPVVCSDNAAPKLVKRYGDGQGRTSPTGDGSSQDVEKIVARLAENFRVAEKHLASPDESAPAQQVQQTILNDLDALIKYSQRAEQAQVRTGTQDWADPGTQCPSLDGRHSSKRSGRSEPRPTAASQRQAKPAQPEATTREETSKSADPDKNVWGHLPEEVRQEMDQYSGTKFMDKYQELTRQYYTTIAEKSRKKETQPR